MEHELDLPREYSALADYEQEPLGPGYPPGHRLNLAKMAYFAHEGVFSECAAATAREVLKSNPYNTLAFRILYNYIEKGERRDVAMTEIANAEKLLQHEPKNFQEWEFLTLVVKCVDQKAMYHDRRQFAEEMLEFCNAVFEQDSRNYHCWDFKLYIIKQFEREFDISALFDEASALISQDPYNASYFNYRWLLFRKLPNPDCNAEFEYLLPMLVEIGAFEHGWNYLCLLTEYCNNPSLSLQIYEFTLEQVKMQDHSSTFALYTAYELVERGIGRKEDILDYLENAPQHSAFFKMLGSLLK